ncbi:Teicoplanin resistance protein VanZ [Rubrivivax sp. A210]|uniref:VanZ family protein n=1 Tax=Rubrivivax sp. A210 TaxID=2772301 RepID=UPI00191A2189|nr:VanZ family protein [Rubrivivax sp. A210]CAD5374637.1 Teicoplanin resistance protein VanZ [Rubrivivax sp. A210]
MPGARPRSASVPLALAYVALVLYASLYPFDGWRWPPGQDLLALAVLPRSVYHPAFDTWSNLLGYMPLGLLLAVAARRGGAGRLGAVLAAFASAALLSYFCELMQHFVPQRVPSREDLALNAAGAVAGAMLALAADALGYVDRWSRLRQRWFEGEAAMALTLLALWPVGLLFPTPVPLGLGQVGERLREGLSELLADVPWAGAAHALLAAPPPAGTPLRPLSEALIVALGLLAPCLVAYAATAPGWRRLAMAAGSAVVGVAGMSVSTLLNFGPSHALAWISPATVPGLTAGLLLALIATPLPRRLAAGLGLVVFTGLVAGVAQAPDNPYFAQSLQAWEQGRFVRFHGLAQWVGWLWPYAAMVWLLAQLAARPRAGR